jgi:hypothetical protein
MKEIVQALHLQNRGEGLSILKFLSQIQATKASPPPLAAIELEASSNYREYLRIFKNLCL